jgi:hypothetical protein
MQKWEYMYVSCAKTEQGDWKFAWVNGNQVPNWHAGRSIYQSSNDVGEQGWELASQDLQMEYNNLVAIRLVFKRPK